PASDAAPAIDITSLDHGDTAVLGTTSMDGQQGLDRGEGAASPARAPLADVPSAAKVGDGPYVPIGTDDTPPYRVFWDASTVAGQTDARVSFRAIVNDLSGHVACD